MSVAPKKVREKIAEIRKGGATTTGATSKQKSKGKETADGEK